MYMTFDRHFLRVAYVGHSSPGLERLRSRIKISVMVSENGNAVGLTSILDR